MTICKPMRRYYILFLLFSISHFATMAQNTNNVWAFGFGNGIDFNTTPPTPISTRSYALEGSASISDATGQLLMYTTGDTVYNRNNQPMPNGGGILNLVGGGFGSFYASCTQGNVIAARPGFPDQYYVFTLEGISDGLTTGRLYYNLVDMTLDGGLGDVVPGQKGIQIDSFLQEKMTVVAGGCNMEWLIVKPQQALEYHSYKITEEGISTVPVISPINNPPFQVDDYIAGVIKFSHNGTRMASANVSYNDMQYGFELYDFDKTTGILSNPVTLSYVGVNDDWLTMAYGACFSPDDTKLYVSDLTSLKQYDISLPTTASIINSVVIIDSINLLTGFNYFGDIQMAPDNRLYISRGGSVNYVSSIEQPNAAGLSCGYVDMALDLSGLGGGTGMFSMGAYGLPNDIANPAVDSQQVFIHDTITCDTVFAASSVIQGTHIWNTGAATAAIAISESGTYWVRSLSGCGTIDTFHVLIDSVAQPGVTLNDTVICSAPLTSLNVSGITEHTDGVTNYNWQPSAAIISNNGNSVVVNPAVSDKIYLTVTNSKGSLCTASQSDSMNIAFVYLKEHLQDETICKGSPVNISRDVSDVYEEGASILWSNGTTLPVANFTDSGTYWVQVTDSPCSVSDTFSIQLIECDCQPLVPNAFSPNGDGINDYFKPVVSDESCLQYGGYALKIFNRWGELVYAGAQNDKGWDGTYKGKPSEAGAYFYNFKYKLGLKGVEGNKQGDLILLR